MPWEKQFDRVDALQRAQRIFWRRGYEESSLNVPNGTDTVENILCKLTEQLLW